MSTEEEYSFQDEPALQEKIEKMVINYTAAQCQDEGLNPAHAVAVLLGAASRFGLVMAKEGLMAKALDGMIADLTEFSKTIHALIEKHGEDAVRKDLTGEEPLKPEEVPTHVH